MTILVSPVIWLLVSRAPVLLLCGLLVLWLNEQTLWIFLKLDVVGFFCLGAAIAIHGWRRHFPERFVAPLVAIFLALVLARTVAPVFLEAPEENWWLYATTCVMRIVGVLSLWSVAPYLMVGAMKVVAARFADLAFFVHCAHYPPILFLKAALGSMLLPRSDMMHLALYFGTIGLTLVTVVSGSRLLRRISPGLFVLLGGGRFSSDATGTSRAAA